MPELVLPPPPSSLSRQPPLVEVDTDPPPVEAPPMPRSADELLAEQLSRLDLDLNPVAPAERLPVEPTLDEDDLRLDLRGLVPSLDPVEDLQLEHEPSSESAASEPRVRPLGDRFPVLSVPELEVSGAPRPPRANPPEVTLAALRFPDDPLPVAAPSPVQGLAGSRTGPLPDGVPGRDEVSPSLLSESVAGDAPGDLSAHWAAEAPAQAIAATPARRAEDEVDTFGPDALKGLQFLRRARRDAFWRRPLVRSALGLMTLLLTVALVLQWAVHERARLVAAEPSLKPAIQALCDVLGCDLAPLRRIESFVIESSSFNKTHGDGFQLALSIHNTSAWPLAMPAAELSLTDSQDQPVLRRVFLPAELGAPTTLGPGADWNTALPVRVVGASSLRIAGYRVLVFYP